jgi:hypothetical protein
MSTFDSSTKVKRAVDDPMTDHRLPHPKTLVWGAITAPTALAGTTGAHCELVHGNHWSQIDGNLTEHIQADVTTNIQGDRSYIVTGNQTQTTIGNITSTVVGAQTRTHLGPQNGTHLAPVSDTYRTNVYIDHSCDWVQVQDRVAQLAWLVMNLELFEFDFAGLGAYFQEIFALTGAPVVDMEWKGIHMEEHIVHLEEHLTSPDFHLLKAEVDGASASVAGGRASVAPNAGVPPHPPLTSGH